MADQEPKVVDDQSPETADTPATEAAEVAAEPLTVSIEDTGPARKSLRIEVPESRISDKIKESYTQLKEEALVPGFRRGRAPMQLLERRFGSSVRDEVKAQLLSESFSEAVESHDLQVIGEPDVKEAESIELPDNGSLTFEVEVEVTPEVELPSLEGIELKKPAVSVTDEMVQAEIALYRERFGQMTKVEDATIAHGDYVTADVRILAGEDADDDADELAHHPGAFVLVRAEGEDQRGHVAGIVVEDLGKRLAGKKAGHVERISMTGPQSHENDRIRSQPITLVIKAEDVQRLQPAPLESVLETMGLETADELEQRVREGLEQRTEGEQQQAMREQVEQYLLDHVDLELPEGLTGRQTERLLQRQRMMLAMRGVPEQEVDQRLAELRSESEESARRQLKLFFIMNQAAQELNIEVAEAEVNGQIAMMAVRQGRRPEKVRQEMQRSGEIEQIYIQARENKTLDAIIDKAEVREVDPEELAQDGEDSAGQNADDADDGQASAEPEERQ